MPSDTTVIAVIFGVVLIGAIGAYLVQHRRYKKGQKIRGLVAGWMAEHRAARQQMVECQHCLHGKTWRPEIVAKGFPVDSEEPWMEDCKVCDGAGLLPRKRLN